MVSWHVAPEESGVKLVFFLQSKIPLSSRQLKRAIEGNLCLVNHLVERFASFIVKAGDLVTFHMEAMVSLPQKKFSKEKQRILLEDDVLFLYNKPVGITESGLLEILCPMKLTHRLDRETTGVMIFAKTKEAQKHVTTLFKERKIGKTYVALVDGIPQRKCGIVENFLERGKYARTDWEVVREGQQCAWLRCFPKTGRTHQIRRHLKEIGHPILGDYQYQKGFRCSYHAKRCLLHAENISFTHPVTGEEIHVHAPFPKDFECALEALFLK